MLDVRLRTVATPCGTIIFQACPHGVCERHLVVLRDDRLELTLDHVRRKGTAGDTARKRVGGIQFVAAPRVRRLPLDDLLWMLVARPARIDEIGRPGATQ